MIDDDILGLTTPLFRKHVNPFGKYHFDLELMRQAEGGPEEGISLNGGFRWLIVQFVKMRSESQAISSDQKVCSKNRPPLRTNALALED